MVTAIQKESDNIGIKFCLILLGCGHIIGSYNEIIDYTMRSCKYYGVSVFSFNFKNIISSTYWYETQESLAKSLTVCFPNFYTSKFETRIKFLILKFEYIWLYREFISLAPQIINIKN